MINFELSGLDGVSGKTDFGRESFAFIRLDRDTCMLQTCQYIIDVFDMASDRVLVDDNVFETDETRFPHILSEYGTNGSLKERRNVC